MSSSNRCGLLNQLFIETRTSQSALFLSSAGCLSNLTWYTLANLLNLPKLFSNKLTVHRHIAVKEYSQCWCWPYSFKYVVYDLNQGLQLISWFFFFLLLYVAKNTKMSFLLTPTWNIQESAKKENTELESKKHSIQRSKFTLHWHPFFTDLLHTLRLVFTSDGVGLKIRDVEP